MFSQMTSRFDIRGVSNLDNVMKLGKFSILQIFGTTKVTQLVRCSRLNLGSANTYRQCSFAIATSEFRNFLEKL